jgi:UDP-glucose 4-epimerase
MKKNKKILVTGGAGYIGSHTVIELIQSGYEPVIIDNFSNAERSVIDRLEEIAKRKIKLYEGDCKDCEFLEEIFEKEEGLQGIIHFAAFKSVNESITQPLTYFDNNMRSLMAVLQLVETKKIAKLIFSSSCTVYGETSQLPVTEETPMQKATSPYGLTKQMGEEIIQNTLAEGAIILRYFNPVGAHPSGLIGEVPASKPENLAPFITQTAAGVRKQLTVFGADYDTPDGTCIRDFIHVSDLAIAHVAALNYLDKQDTIDVFNVGTGKGNSVYELIDAFESVNGIKVNFKVGPRRPGDIVEIYADTDKANKILGWESKYTIKDAMKHAWTWENFYRNKLNKTADMQHSA